MRAAIAGLTRFIVDVPTAASTAGIATNANFLIVKACPPVFGERQKGAFIVVSWLIYPAV
jgi:hypothetical protein